MASVAYKVQTPVFAAPAAVHTLLMAIAPSGHGLVLVLKKISFDGVSASAVGCLVEYCFSTQAGAGTPGSSPTPVQIRGRSTAGQVFTAGANYTAEPTVLTPFDSEFITPNAGLWWEPNPFGREIEIDSSAGTVKGAAIRITPTAVVNVHATFEVENL